MNAIGGSIPTLKEGQYYIRVEKKSDNKFAGKHPNGIDAGYVKEGIADRMPEIGQSVVLHRFGGSFWTSTVIAVRENEFDTQNSTYKYWILADGRNQHAH